MVSSSPESDRYKTIVEQAEEGIWTIDREGRTTFVNQRMADMLGYTKDEMMGQPHTDFMFPEDRPKGDTDMESRRQGTREQWDQRYRCKNGSTIWTLASCCALFDAEGKVIGALGWFIDITARKKVEADLRLSEEKLQRALLSRDNAIAVLSHELRIPLNPILLLASDGIAHAALPEDVRNIFKSIADNARQQATLIDDLLDLTRFNQHKVTLRVRRLNLRALIDAAIAAMTPEAKAKNISLLTTAVETPATFVEADPERIQQVLCNVLKNAVKFSPSESTIRVELSAESGRSTMRVVDQGVGMVATELSRIFEPFSQGDHASEGHSPQYGGLGLGLALSRILVELHHGSIRAESQGLGRGTTVAIELPTVGASEVAAAVPSTAPVHGAAKAGGAPMRILLVEDHAPTRAALEALLKRRAHSVVAVASTAAAKKALAQGTFDLLVSDLGLPDGDGCALMKFFGEHHGSHGIALTGFGRQADIARSREAGFVAHLTKPIDVSSLDAALTAIGIDSLRPSGGEASVIARSSA